MRYRKRQFEILKLRAMAAYAEIISGAYLLQKAEHGYFDKNGNYKFRELTDKEKLLAAHAKMNSFIHWMEEVAEEERELFSKNYIEIEGELVS